MNKTHLATSEIQKALNLFRLLTKRDKYTGEHSLHVAYMALNISKFIKGHFGKEKLFIAGLLQILLIILIKPVRILNNIT